MAVLRRIRSLWSEGCWHSEFKRHIPLVYYAYYNAEDSNQFEPFVYSHPETVATTSILTSHTSGTTTNLYTNGLPATAPHE